MRITKELANIVAVQLVKGYYDKMIEDDKIFKDIVKEEYLKQIPEEVLKFTKKYPEYSSFTQRILLNSNGFSWKYIYINEKVPMGNSPELEMNKDVASRIDKAYKKKEKSTDEYNQLKRDIETALYNLKTFKRVEEEFPEAAKYLPKATTIALTVDLTKIRKKIA